MHPTTPTGKAPKGTVKVISSHGRLQLRFRHGGKRHYLSIGLPDTPTNWIAAEQKAQQIYLDIVSGNFDPSLNKYRPEPAAQPEPPATTPTTPNAVALLNQYIEYKAPAWKVTTLADRENLARQLAKIPATPVTDALTVKAHLQEVTTPDQVRRVLIQLNAACRWAVKHQLIETNPYEGMASDMPKPRYQLEPRPNAFSREERDQVIEAFKRHQGNWNGRGFTGIRYRHYAPFVEFLFLTGCRPSEAVGLRWENVAEDFDHIRFVEAITTAGSGKPVRVKGSKNNRQRTVPCSKRLEGMLAVHKPDNAQPDALVFPAPKGGPIHYNNFCNNAWKRIVGPIKTGTTPYSCRDTFITLQILNRVPESLIAQWCDTSVDMIQRHYADFLKMMSLRPED